MKIQGRKITLDINTILIPKVCPSDIMSLSLTTMLMLLLVTLTLSHELDKNVDVGNGAIDIEWLSSTMMLVMVTLTLSRELDNNVDVGDGDIDTECVLGACDHVLDNAHRWLPQLTAHPPPVLCQCQI